MQVPGARTDLYFWILAVLGLGTHRGGPGARGAFMWSRDPFEPFDRSDLPDLPCRLFKLDISFLPPITSLSFTPTSISLSYFFPQKKWVAYPASQMTWTSKWTRSVNLCSAWS